MSPLSLERWKPVCAMAAISGTFLCQLAGCVRPSAPMAVRSGVQSTPQIVRGLDTTALNVVRREFTTFALNALLLPLLDDDVPARWADPSHSMDCNGARVTVDGDRLDVGAPVPQAFTVRWHMDGCVPFGQYLEMSGAVELSVESNERGYTAHVHPTGLKLVTPAGAQTLTEPFTASLAVDVEGRP